MADKLPSRDLHLTPGEAWYLECLRRLSTKLRRPPTIRELGEFCGRSLGPTQKALAKLTAKGRLTRNGEGRYARYHIIETEAAA
jgi:predicted transcriptional regulator of viral defense system